MQEVGHSAGGWTLCRLCRRLDIMQGVGDSTGGRTQCRRLDTLQTLQEVGHYAGGRTLCRSTSSAAPALPVLLDALLPWPGLPRAGKAGGSLPPLLSSRPRVTSPSSCSRACSSDSSI